MADDQKEATQRKTSSKQLLYAEKFGGTLLERKLRIFGKKARLTKPCLPPQSSVLSRVKTLLPKLQAANEELKSIPQKDVAIEISDTECDGPAIEMNLALMPSMGNSDSNDNSSSEEEESDEDENGKDSDEDSEKKDSDSEDGPSISELLAPLNNQRNSRKRKVVEVLDEEDDNDGSDEEKDDGKRLML